MRLCSFLYIPLVLIKSAINNIMPNITRSNITSTRQGAILCICVLVFLTVPACICTVQFKLKSFTWSRSIPMDLLLPEADLYIHTVCYMQACVRKVLSGILMVKTNPCSFHVTICRDGLALLIWGCLALGQS